MSVLLPTGSNCNRIGIQRTDFEDTKTGSPNGALTSQPVDQDHGCPRAIGLPSSSCPPARDTSAPRAGGTPCQRDGRQTAASAGGNRLATRSRRRRGFDPQLSPDPVRFPIPARCHEFLQARRTCPQALRQQNAADILVDRGDGREDDLQSGVGVDVDIAMVRSQVQTCVPASPIDADHQRLPASYRRWPFFLRRPGWARQPFSGRDVAEADGPAGRGRPGRPICRWRRRGPSSVLAGDWRS